MSMLSDMLGIVCRCGSGRDGKEEQLERELEALQGEEEAENTRCCQYPMWLLEAAGLGICTWANAFPLLNMARWVVDLFDQVVHVDLTILGVICLYLLFFYGICSSCKSKDVPDVSSSGKAMAYIVMGSLTVAGADGWGPVGLLQRGGGLALTILGFLHVCMSIYHSRRREADPVADHFESQQEEGHLSSAMRAVTVLAILGCGYVTVLEIKSGAWPPRPILLLTHVEILIGLILILEDSLCRGRCSAIRLSPRQRGVMYFFLGSLTAASGGKGIHPIRLGVGVVLTILGIMELQLQCW